MDAILQDVRLAFRTMRRSAGFTALVVVILALAIGANTTIFGAVSALLLRALPFPDASRLMIVREGATTQGSADQPASYAEFQGWRAHREAFQWVAAFEWWPANLRGKEGAEPIQGVEVSAGLFSLLGETPLLGRDFAVEDEQPGRNLVAILSQDLWELRFGASSEAIGATVILNGGPYTVIGVVPRDAAYPTGAQLWVPLAVVGTRVHNHNLAVVARLRPGVASADAEAVTRSVVRRYEEDFPQSHRGWTTRVLPLAEETTSDARPLLNILLAAVGLVLLIACANAANLLLVRASGRGHEVAIRVALGAGRARIVQQYLTESALLALMAGAVGAAVAACGIHVLKRGVSPELTAFIPGWSRLSLDGRTLIFTAGVAILTGIVFGLAPALRAGRSDPATTLRIGVWNDVNPRTGYVRRTLIVGELALALVLLVGAGLMVRSFVHLLRTDPGFRMDHVLTAELILPPAQYPNAAKITAVQDQILERVASLPGVVSAGLVSSLPLSGYEPGTWFTIKGRPDPAPGEVQRASWQVATPGYFQAMGIPVLRGRSFDATDAADGHPVALINETMAKRYWPGQDPLGARIAVDREREVVGIVRDVRNRSVNRAPEAGIVVPQHQAPTKSLFVVVRTTGHPNSLAKALQGEIVALDPEVAIAHMRSMEDVAAQRVSPDRLIMNLLGIFGALALVISAVGLYANISYAVSQRKREIGIRLALGASPRKVLRMVLRQGLVTAVLGVGIGLLAAVFVTRFMANLLFGVSTTDTVVFIAGAVLLLSVALLASAVPAQRAARVDPMSTLRAE